VNRCGRLGIGITLAVAVIASSAGISAQQPSAAEKDKSRVLELVAYAKATFDQAQQAAQAQAAAPAGQPAPDGRATLPLTADAAVKRALDNNIDLAVEKLNPTLQDWSLRQTRAVYQPNLTSSVNTSSNSPLPTSLLNGGTNVTNDTQNYNVGVNQQLPWYGGNYSVAFNNSKVNTTSTYATLNPQFTTSVTVNVAQPLLRNFKIDSTRNSLLTGAITRDITDLSLKARITNTIANTRNAYWDLLYALKAVDAARQSVRLAEQLVKDNQVRVEVGTLAPLDVVQAQSQAATQRQNLTTLEASLATAELAFKRLVVANTDDALWNSRVEPIDQLRLADPPKVDLGPAVARALKERTDLVTARKNLQSNDVTMNYLRNQVLPQLDLSANYGTRGLGGNTFIFQNGTATGSIPGGYVDSVKMLGHFKYPTWTIGVTFSYPLGTSSQDAALARARVQYQQAQLQVRSLELQAAADVTNAAVNIESAKRRLEAATASRVLYERTLDAEQTKFEVGMQTSYFVIQAQRDLLNAQLVELRAQLDLQKAVVEFERVQVTSASGGTSSVTTVSSGAGTTTTSSTSSSTTRTSSGG
jgi:outer membrane protein